MSSSSTTTTTTTTASSSTTSSPSSSQPAVLFCCLGNICRSPLAQGVLEHVARERGVAVACDSAGTGDYHVGEPPDARGQRCARLHGLDISGQRARQISERDFFQFDLIVVMDQSNLADVLELRASLPRVARVRADVMTLMSFAPSEARADVPDCYYARDVAASFEDVYRVFCEACPNVLQEAVARHAAWLAADGAAS